MATMPVVQGPEGRGFAVYACGLAVVGAGGGLWLASMLHGKELDSDFWKQILTITGVSALPLIAVAIRTPASAFRNWRTVSALTVFGGFLAVLMIVGICLYEMAPFLADKQHPTVASGGALYAACIGVGLVLAAVAAGVVGDFFMAHGGFERQVTSASPLTNAELEAVNAAVDRILAQRATSAGGSRTMEGDG
jgi:hypothetical protein